MPTEWGGGVPGQGPGPEDAGWRDALADARTERGYRTPEEKAWDTEWCRALRLLLGNRRTPNGAVRSATRMTRDRCGPRPGGSVASRAVNDPDWWGEL